MAMYALYNMHDHEPAPEGLVLYAADIGGAKGHDLTKPPHPGGFCVSGMGLRAAAGPQTEDEMSIVEAEEQRTVSPPSMRVRLAGPRDCDALCALLDDPSHAREQVLAWLESPGMTLLVAQSEAGVLGVAVLVTRIVPLAGGLTHKVVEVDNLVVRADLRGQRIGRRLLAAVVEWARQRRAVQVEAVVGEGDGRRFYQSFGFAIANDRLVLTA
jgi:GNAT superfamily N-acetyltransferase